MRQLVTGALLFLMSSAVGAAPAPHQHASQEPAPAAKSAAAAKPAMCAKCAKCPMCAAMKQGGKGGGMMAGMMDGKSGGMMSGRTAGATAAPTVTIAPDGSVLVIRGNTLFKYDSNLNLIAQAELPAPAKHEQHQHDAK